jgi:hypothetical protein
MRGCLRCEEAGAEVLPVEMEILEPEPQCDAPWPCVKEAPIVDQVQVSGNRLRPPWPR